MEIVTILKKSTEDITTWHIVQWVLTSMFSVLLIYYTFYLNQSARRLQKITEDLQHLITSNEVQNTMIISIERDLKRHEKRLEDNEKNIIELRERVISCKYCNP